MTGNSGKGGDISGASWTNTNGIGGGGAGDTDGQFCSIYLIVINMIFNRKLTFVINLQVVKEVLEDIMPEEEGLIL